MKRWIRRTVITAFGATALFGGLAAWAHHRHHGGQNMTEQEAAEMRSRIVDRVGRRLDLDAAQKARLGVLADALREQRKALLGGGDPRTEVQGLLAGPTFDRVKAQALVASKVGAVNAGAPAVIAALGDFYDSLKPDQQAKVRDLLARRGHRG